MPERREDDKIDPITGIPVSAAHQAIYEHIDISCEKVMEHQTKLHRQSDEQHEQHIRERHHPPLNEIAHQLNQTPTQLMEGFIRAMQTSDRVVDALDGPLIKGLDGIEHRDSENGMIAQVKDMQAQLHNGIKHKAELTKAQYALAVAAIGALATIAAALIGGG
jgi:hypothetical protein